MRSLLKQGPMILLVIVSIAGPAYLAATFLTPFLGVVVAVCLALGIGAGRWAASNSGNNRQNPGGKRATARQSKGARSRNDR